MHAIRDDARVYVALFGRQRGASEVYGFAREGGAKLWEREPWGVAPAMHHAYDQRLELRLVDGNLHVVRTDPRGHAVNIIDPATGEVLAHHVVLE